MAIATINDIASGLASSKQTLRFHKNSTAAKAVGSFQSCWLATGIPGAGVAPPLYTAGSGYTASKDTVGALQYINGVTQNWLAKLAASSSIAGTVILADRLWSCSGIPFGASTYNITTPGALPARITDGGVGCEMWVEEFIAQGAVTGTLTIAYLNSVPVMTNGTDPVVAAIDYAISPTYAISLYNGLPVWYSPTKALYIFWDTGTATWYIYTAVGVGIPPGKHYLRNNTSPVGIYAAGGGGAGTPTFAFGSAKSGVLGTLATSPVIGQMQPIPLQAGDVGISQIISWTNSQTWTSNSAGITILKRIAEIEVPIIGASQSFDWARLGLPQIPSDACLMLLWQANATTACLILGRAEIIDK